MEVSLLIASAVAPGAAIVVYVYCKDRFEKEPLKLLVKSFIWGVGSIVPAIVLELAAGAMRIGAGEDAGSIWLRAFIVVAMSEEWSKYLVLRWVAYPQKDFNEPFDGIVYSAMVAMGFATAENIAYVVEGGWNVALVRMFTSVPAHATFGVMMGYFVGLSKFKGHRRLLQFAGLGSAVLFHGTYDFFLMVNNVPLLALGALASFFVGVRLSLRAMKLTEEISPFRPPQQRHDQLS